MVSGAVRRVCGVLVDSVRSTMNPPAGLSRSKTGLSGGGDWPALRVNGPWRRPFDSPLIPCDRMQRGP